MFSVVIPLYNKAKSIEDTINLVLNQTFEDFEIIVVDDGSTDDSVEIIESFNDNRIKLFKKSNGGVSSARNRGIEKSLFPFIALLDADDIWESNYLLEQSKLISDFPNAGMWGIALGYYSLGTKKDINHGLIPGYRGIIDNYWTMKKRSNIFSASSVVIARDAFFNIGQFDERISIGEDLDLWYRIMLNFPVAFYNKTLAYYKIDAENRAMNKHVPFNKFLPFYFEKYSDYRNTNVHFRKFFDHFCLRAIYPYYFRTETRKDVRRILKQIDFSVQPVRWRLQYMFPWLFKYIFLTKSRLKP